MANATYASGPASQHVSMSWCLRLLVALVAVVCPPDAARASTESVRSNGDGHVRELRIGCAALGSWWSRMPAAGRAEVEGAWPDPARPRPVIIPSRRVRPCAPPGRPGCARFSTPPHGSLSASSRSRPEPRTTSRVHALDGHGRASTRLRRSRMLSGGEACPRDTRRQSHRPEHEP